ncbi:MAG: sugar ABC transporter permease, partial [Boseongicola sp. SB0675_bin_26]|nr:sugar ABC transporter permease [Boseongicola sp. SB0675_bin_26]
MSSGRAGFRPARPLPGRRNGIETDTAESRGLAVAGPAFLLIAAFLIIPFFMAIGFSFTNQRLVSPNPTEWVGTANYERLFGIAVLTLEAERGADGAVRTKDGEPVFPSLRSYTRNRDDHPEYYRKREWFSFGRGDERRTFVLATDVVFLKAVRNTLF